MCHICLSCISFAKSLRPPCLQVMAVTRVKICESGMGSLPRGYLLAYYTSVFLYYWVFSTPVVSLVFGSYLYACINWFHLHFDEAFSSLRIANYKSFSRFHITPTGDLHVYTLAIDKVSSNNLAILWHVKCAFQFFPTHITLHVTLL